MSQDAHPQNFCSKIEAYRQERISFKIPSPKKHLLLAIDIL